MTASADSFAAGRLESYLAAHVHMRMGRARRQVFQRILAIREPFDIPSLAKHLPGVERTSVYRAVQLMHDAGALAVIGVARTRRRYVVVEGEHDGPSCPRCGHPLQSAHSEP